MKLTSKWFVWFSLIGIYVMLLGGVFYYNLFKWTFDEKLKSEVLEMVTLKSPELMDGLLRNANAITFDEYGVIEFLGNDKRIIDILYLDGSGKIRWFKHSNYLGADFESFVEETSYNPQSIWQVYRTGRPAIIKVKKEPLYDIAIPFKAKGEDIIGVLNLRVSREGANKIIASAMRKYVVGAVLVLLFLGIPLWLFLKLYIVNPIISLSNSIEGVSSKSFEIKFGARSDEVGTLARSVAGLLEKVRRELEFVSGKEDQIRVHENKWWEVVLKSAAPKNTKAVVVDEDNNVLFANFELNKLDPDQKLHLLDVIDTERKDVVKMVAMAMENPNTTVEADTVFKSQPVHAKVVQVESKGRLRRILILFESKAA